MYFVNDARGDMYSFPVGYVNFPSTGARGISTNFYTGFAVFDNGDAQKLAAAKAFVKYIYESDFIDYSSGSIPCSKRVIEKYAEELTGLQRYIKNADTAVLIMYYKQVSEGYEDRSRFDILRKVGMSRKEIRQSINSQVLTVFFLPLAAAGVHMIFAFPIISRMLRVFGMNDSSLSRRNFPRLHVPL